MVGAIANLSPIPPVAAHTNLPSLAAQAAELAESKKLSQQTLQLSKEGKYSEALPLAQKAVVICEKTLGREHPDEALSLISLASLEGVMLCGKCS